MRFPAPTLNARRPAAPLPTAPRILAIAYTCVPGSGSEPGVGWAWSRILAGIGETVVLTRPIPGVDARLDEALAAAPEGRSLRVVEVASPAWIARLEGRSGRHRLERLEYLVWMAMALRAARRLHGRRPFDLVWHLTYANAWLGSVGSLVGPPFILGPVGGGVSPPWRLVTTLSLREQAHEVVRVAVRTASRWLNPLARLTIRRAAVILAQNEDTRRWLPAAVRPRTIIFPNVVLERHPGVRERRPGPPTVLFVGRLLGFKGVHLALRVMTLLPEWRLVFVGDGPARARLELEATELGLRERVEFRGWLDNDRVHEAMRRDADVLLFPSFHDEAGMVVVEALASGLPVVCLDRGGPPALGGIGVAATTPDETVRRLAAAVREAASVVPDTSAVRDIAQARGHVREILEAHGVLRPRPPRTAEAGAPVHDGQHRP